VTRRIRPCRCRSGWARGPSELSLLTLARILCPRLGPPDEHRESPPACGRSGQLDGVSVFAETTTDASGHEERDEVVDLRRVVLVSFADDQGVDEVGGEAVELDDQCRLSFGHTWRRMNGWGRRHESTVTHSGQGRQRKTRGPICTRSFADGCSPRPARQSSATGARSSPRFAQSAPHGLGDKQRDEVEARDGQGMKEGSATAVDHYARMCRVVATCHVHVLTIAASS